MAKFDTAKNLFSILQAIAAVAALGAGLYWWYETREGYPRANHSHVVLDKQISEDLRWISVEARLENIGKTRIELTKARVLLDRILPLSDDLKKRIEEKTALVGAKSKRIKWPNIDAFDTDVAFFLEPGEVDSVVFDFLVDGCVRTFRVYTHFENKEVGNEYGWARSTIHDAKVAGQYCD